MFKQYGNTTVEKNILLTNEFIGWYTVKMVFTSYIMYEGEGLLVYECVYERRVKYEVII